MAGTEKYLLSTRPLPKHIIEAGAQRGVTIEELSFIETRPVIDDSISNKINEVATRQHVVVFTSMNAVEAVASQLKTSPSWKVYCLGNTTRQLVEKYWGASSVSATADDARLLGERLVDDGIVNAIFFCGNIRRNELPNKMRSEGGTVEEIVVYQTIETPATVSRFYHGILFFSPSAVNSFFQANKPEAQTTYFAIGRTTKDSLQQHKAQRIIIAGKPDKNELALHAINHLTRQ